MKFRKEMLLGLTIAASLGLMACSKDTEEVPQLQVESRTQDATQDIAQDAAQDAAQDIAQDAEQSDPVAEAESTQDAKTIYPLPTTIDVNNLTDATINVGFVEKTDAYMDESKFVIRMDVYDMERFDMVDIATLEVGDTIMIMGDAVKVETKNEAEDGSIQINGGLDLGGYSLYSNDEGSYVNMKFSDYIEYYKVGEVTLPVGEDFTLTDSTDLDKGEQVTYPGDMIVEAPSSDAEFLPANTTARIENGYIVSIEHTYMP